MSDFSINKFGNNYPKDNTNIKKDKKEVELNLLTLNTQLLPDFVFAGNSVLENLKKVSRIPETIVNFDFVGLQETFSDISQLLDKPKSDLDKIKKYTSDDKIDFSELKQIEKIFDNKNKLENFKDRHREDNGNLVLQDSGLTVFSKNKIVEKDFKQYSWSTGSDSFSRKGVVFTRVSIPDIGYVDIYNTHLQANYGNSDSSSKLFDNYKKGKTNFIENIIVSAYEPLKKYNNSLYPSIQMSQVDEISEFIKKNDKGYPTFIMGDFNMEEGSKEYNYMMSKLGFNDSFRNFTNEKGYTFVPGENPNIKDKGKPERLDYILFKNGNNSKIDIVESKVTHKDKVDGEVVSDHYGVNTKFKITKNN